MLYYFKCLGGIADYKRDEVRLGKCLRPAYHVENSGSRPTITEVKQRRARLVLGWWVGDRRLAIPGAAVG